MARYDDEARIRGLKGFHRDFAEAAHDLGVRITWDGKYPTVHAADVVRVAEELLRRGKVSQESVDQLKSNFARPAATAVDRTPGVKKP